MGQSVEVLQYVVPATADWFLFFLSREFEDAPNGPYHLPLEPFPIVPEDIQLSKRFFLVEKGF